MRFQENTFNTQKGLYQYTQLPFEVASTLSIVQWTMTNLLKGIPKVCVYLGDILITGATKEEHLTNSSEVPSCLENAGMHLRGKMCFYFLRLKIWDTEFQKKAYVHPTEEKLKANTEAPKTYHSSNP